MDINIILKNLKKNYYENLQYTLSKNHNANSIHVNFLNKILDTDETNLIETNSTEIEPIESKNNSDNNELYTKPWNKLNPIHKILKIKEFVNNLKNTNDSNKAELKDELSVLVKTKVLTKKEKVNYDEKNGKIISLVSLQYKDGKYIYLQE
jgi:hypothetical protein